MTESNLPTLAESQGDICYSDEDYDKPYTPRPVEKHRKLIDGYHCEVEIDPTEDPSTQGWVTRGSYASGTMQLVLDQGYVTTAGGARAYKIHDRTLHRIEDWAYSVGY